MSDATEPTVTVWQDGTLTVNDLRGGYEHEKARADAAEAENVRLKDAIRQAADVHAASRELERIVVARADAAEAKLARVREIATTGRCDRRISGELCDLYRKQHLNARPPHQFKRPAWETALEAALADPSP